MTRPVLLLGIFLGSCRTAPERAGDRLYAGARYEEAAAAYDAGAVHGLDGAVRQLATGARLGAADRAADAARRLVAATPDRRGEVGAWLRVAAERLPPDSAGAGADLLRAAADVLGAATPASFAPIAAAALLDPALADDDGLDRFVPLALAGETGDETPDRLLLRLARHAETGGRCEVAEPQFRAVLRRARVPSAAAEALRGAVGCTMALGERALTGGDPIGAEARFAGALRLLGADSASVEARAALTGIGRARAMRGDESGARTAFAAAAARTPGDSTTAPPASGPAMPADQRLRDD